MFRTLSVHQLERRYISCISQLVYVGTSGRDVLIGRTGRVQVKPETETCRAPYENKD